MNERYIDLLEALATFKFLTYEQIIRLGIGKYSSNLSKDFKYLSERTKPLVSKVRKRYVTDTVKFFLTKYGKKHLIEHQDWKENQIKYVPQSNIDLKQIDHVVATIDSQIGLHIACQNSDAEILFCDTYFDKVRDNQINKKLKSKTAFLFNQRESIKADLAFMLQTSKQKELYFLEFENGDDSKKSALKCMNHAKGIYFGHANKKYNFKSGYRTLWIFEKESTLSNTIKRISSAPLFEHLAEYFLFKTLDTAQSESFFNDWINLKNETRKLFYL